MKRFMAGFIIGGIMSGGIAYAQIGDIALLYIQDALNDLNKRYKEIYDAQNSLYDYAKAINNDVEGMRRVVNGNADKSNKRDSSQENAIAELAHDVAALKRQLGQNRNR